MGAGISGCSSNKPDPYRPRTDAGPFFLYRLYPFRSVSFAYAQQHASLLLPLYTASSLADHRATRNHHEKQSDLLGLSCSGHHY